jgi:ubiquinone/menaquinone biosynthesis C-methylase UbiE
VAILPDLRTRLREDEWMDAPDVEPAKLQRSLRFIRRINALLGYTRATLRHFDRFSQSWKAGETIGVLDVATGSADIPLAIATWARRRCFDVRIVGLDRHPVTSSIARVEAASNGCIQIVRGDALRLPFADASFDYVTNHMFLHHLDDGDVVRALIEMNRVARRGILWADLLRHKRAYLWSTLLTVAGNPMVKHDARLSVAQAFTKPEVLSLCQRASVTFAQYFRHFGHRFVVAGEKHSQSGFRETTDEHR